MEELKHKRHETRQLEVGSCQCGEMIIQFFGSLRSGVRNAPLSERLESGILEFWSSAHLPVRQQQQPKTLSRKYAMSPSPVVLPKHHPEHFG